MLTISLANDRRRASARKRRISTHHGVDAHANHEVEPCGEYDPRGSAGLGIQGELGLVLPDVVHVDGAVALTEGDDVVVGGVEG